MHNIFLVALEDILNAFTIPENELKLRSAREKAGNDMLKMMQIFFPVATQIQMDVIPKYGFSSDGDGNLSLEIHFLSLNIGS